MSVPPQVSERPATQTLRWVFRPIAWMESCRRRYGESFGVRFLGFESPLWFISDPAAVKALYGPRDNTLPPGREATLEPVMGPRSILLLEGREHLARRKLMLPPFHGERMRAYEETIAAATRREIASWPRGTPLRLHPRMQAITLEVILRAVFGVQEGERLAELRGRLRTLLRRTASPAVQLFGLAARRLPVEGPMRRIEAALHAADDLLLAEIAERRADPAAGEREDILSLLVSARFDDGTAMSDAELRDQLVTLLLAGHETTATALAWAFDLLLRNPPALSRLRDEVEAGGDEYLRAAIAETLRIRPVVPIAGRRIAADLEVGSHTLPAGSDVTPAIYLLHTRPDLYPEPHAFRPERFLGGGPQTYAWAPFGGGVRRCLGAAFAEFEMRIVLTEVLRSCELAPARERPETIARRNITLSPRGGTEVVVGPRRAAAAAA